MDVNTTVKPNEDFERTDTPQKELKEVVYFEGTPPEEMKYLILLKLFEDQYDNGDMESFDWVVMVGRESVYKYLKDLTIGEAIDIDDSFVLGEETKMKDAVTVYEFLVHMIKSGKIIETDESFRPVEYRTHAEDAKCNRLADMIGK